MNSEKKETKNTEEKKETRFNMGEKGFSIFFFLVGLFFTWQSAILYKEHPGASSCGSVPLFCSVVIMLFSLITILFDLKKVSENTGKVLSKMILDTWNSIMPLDVIVMIVLMVLYCTALYMGIGFMWITPVFLWGSMTFLCRGNYIKNILWSALCMLFIYVVFHMLFSVVLP